MSETDWQAKYQKLAGKYRELRNEHTEALSVLDQAVSRVEELEQQPGLEELQAELEALYGDVREGTHRSAFEEQADAMGLDKAARDDAWELLKLDTEADEPDAKAIKQQLGEWLKARPYLKTKPTGDDETDADSGDEDDAETDGDGMNGFRDALDLAPPVKASGKAKAETRELVGAGAGTGAKSNGKPSLSRGEGYGQGGRDNHRGKTMADIVDADFAATGRDDAFKI